MASVYIDNQWHTYSQWTYKTIYGTLNASISGTTVTASFSGYQYTTYQKQGSRISTYK